MASNTLVCGVGPDGQLTGNIFPMSDWEVDLSDGFRQILYLVALLWTFMGVAIGADVFMSSIEVITSKTTSVQIDGKTFHTHVWNPTVANLTLMALGSSAPEILLSVIEIYTGEFYSGDLGPSTIVGSAAFNLMVISGICVSALPVGDGRYIKDVQVFYLTAFFSVFAYIWLIIILSVITPNFVSVMEAVVTFLFFPLLVYLAYGAEKGWFKKSLKKQELVEPEEYGTIISATGDVDPQIQAAILAKIKKQNRNGKLSLDELRKLVSYEIHDMAPKSRAHYRIQATREKLGGKVNIVPPTVRAGMSVSFACADGQVVENQPQFVTKVLRSEPLTQKCTVKYYTEDGTAKSGEDYVAQSGTLTFNVGESEKEIAIQILDDNEYEGDETFKIRLSDASAGEIGLATCTVLIIDDDLPGTFGWDQDGEYRVDESVGKLVCTVSRRNGCTGEASVKYQTRDGTGADKAIATKDYEEASGELVFADGETAKQIEVVIFDDTIAEKDEQFSIELFDATNGTGFDTEHHNYDSEANVMRATVVIESDDKYSTLMAHLGELMNAHTFALGNANYKGQFRAALSPTGGVPLSPGERLHCSVWIMHTLTLPWKLFFAFIPPTDFCGGWLCFIVALLFIGIVTMIIGDLASLFGCCLGIEDATTAITFVALGTSLPDTFASMAAARGDRYADASIGNVTGSNSVNVFLGLGMPWLMAAFYWATVDDDLKAEWHTRFSAAKAEDPVAYSWYKEGMDVGFAVPAGDLSFSVQVFSFCAISTIGFLILRRHRLGYELGMAYEKPTTIFFICLWLFYVSASVLKTRKMV